MFGETSLWRYFLVCWVVFIVDSLSFTCFWSIGMLPNPLSITVLMMWVEPGIRSFLSALPCAHFCFASSSVVLRSVLNGLIKWQKTRESFLLLSQKSHIQNYKKKFKEKHPLSSVCCRFPSSPFTVALEAALGITKFGETSKLAGSSLKFFSQREKAFRKSLLYFL